MLTRQQLPPVEWGSALRLFLGCIVFTTAIGAWAFHTRSCPPGRRCPTLGEWLDGPAPSLKAALVGLGSGVAFGFIDNCLLFLGIASLDTLFERLPYAHGDSRVIAGYGNTFSSAFSALASTFVGRGIASATHMDVDDAPLWSMALGLVAGGLVGIAVPRALLGPSQS